VKCQLPNVTVMKVYKPQEGQIHVHQTRVTPCPKEFPAGYYWYGHNSKATDCVLEWVNQMLNDEWNFDNSDETGELLQLDDERRVKETKETVSESMETMIESEESQLERYSTPNDEAGVSVQQREDVANRQYGTPYCLHPRLQPPAHYK